MIDPVNSLVANGPVFLVKPGQPDAGDAETVGLLDVGDNSPRAVIVALDGPARG